MLHETGPGQHLARPLHRARGREGPVGALEQRPLHAADGGHRVQVVAGEKLLQAHPGASRVLQRDIALAARLGRHGPGRDALTAHPGELAVEAHVPRVEAVGLVAPAGFVVGAGHGIPAEEGAGGRIEGEGGVHEVGGVGEVQHVLGLPQGIVHSVLGQPPEKRDVGAGPDGHVDVGHLGRCRAQRVHDDPQRPRVPGALDPAQGQRLACGNVGTQGEQTVRVRDVAPQPVGLGDAEGGRHARGEGAPPEGRLGIDVHHAPRSQRLGEQELLLSHKARAAEAADGPSAHDRHAAGTLPGAVVVVAVAIVAVAAAIAPVPFVEARLALRLIVGLRAFDALFEGGVASILHQVGDLVQRAIPGDVLPRIRPGAPHPGRGQAPGTGRRRAFARGVVAARAIATIVIRVVLGRPLGRLPQVGQRLSAQAEPPFREWIRAVAVHGRHPPVLHIEHQRAGARTLLADDDRPRRGRRLFGRRLVGAGGLFGGLFVGPGSIRIQTPCRASNRHRAGAGQKASPRQFHGRTSPSHRPASC